jgi:hypothetical protein
VPMTINPKLIKLFEQEREVPLDQKKQFAAEIRTLCRTEPIAALLRVIMESRDDINMLPFGVMLGIRVGGKLDPEDKILVE